MGTVQMPGELGQLIREQVPVAVQRDRRGGMAELGLDRLDAGALDDEQARAGVAKVWMRRSGRPISAAAAKAQLEGLTVSASDVIRLALSRLQEQVSDKQLHQDLVAHVLAEAEQYPGRAKRGLPTG